MILNCFFLILLWCVFPAWCGQSLVSSAGYAQNTSVPLPTANSDFRVEGYAHDWQPTGTHGLASFGGFTSQIFYSGGSTFFYCYNARETGSEGTFTVNISDLPNRAVYFRWQHDGTNRIDYLELWDSTGRRVYFGSKTYATESGGSNGAAAGAIGSDAISIAFFRGYASTVALNSTPPVTADTSTAIFQWKFDNSLADSGPGGYTAAMSSGSPSYASTPYQTAFSVIKANSTPWSNWTSLRAGAEQTLTGSQSYSQADASSSVTCFWQALDGPSMLTWSSHSECDPTITGIIFGDYRFQLVVTDAANQTATSTTHVGAVAMDSNGIVIQADPNADTIFGPMIAFGQNPWGYADERNLAMVGLQDTYLATNWPASQPWMTPGTGTVAYRFTSVGPPPGATPTTLTAGINATDTSIAIADASKLSLTSLPTWITIGDTLNAQEIVRICSTTATTGTATLTVCYNGRGISGTAGTYVAAQSWSSGVAVGEMRVQGTSTLFATDANSAICPAGVPGPAGAVAYSTGTVTMSASSTTLVGSGTTWNSGNGVSANRFVRIAATHATGTDFVFWARITSVTDTTHLVMDRAAPSDIDGTAFTYQITTGAYFSLGFAAPDGSGNQRAWQYLHGCESETAAFAAPAHDIPAVSSAQTGQEYSYINGFGVQSAFGPNFYGTGLALRAFYYRSGLQQALDLANQIDNTWVIHPEMCAGWCGGIPLLQGGGVLGAMANVILNPSATIAWKDVRKFGVTAQGVQSSTCDNIDTRDSGYYGAWATLQALYDTDAAAKATARTSLQGINTRDQSCKTRSVVGIAPEANSWANGFIFNGSASPALTLTNGSTAVTGTGLTSGLCFGTATVSITVTNGSASFTAASGLIDGNQIMITGTLSGSLFVASYTFTQSGGTSGTLGALWPGDSGTFSATIQNNDAMSAISTATPSNADLIKNWACTYVDSTHLTLNRAWDGTTGSSYHIYSYGLAGYGQQPYMLGIKATGMKWASSLDGTLSTSFGTNFTAAATWIHDYGYDPITQGMFYGRLFNLCEPVTTPPVSPTFDTRTPGCNYALNPAAIRAARVLTAEASSGLRGFYEANPGATAKTWGDTAYGSIWGYAPYTTGGVYSDSNYVRDENSDASLGSYKWPGFFFGMGMAHQWPASRNGGIPTPDPRTWQIAFTLPAGADLRRLYIRRPSGEAVTVDCVSSPCSFTYDAAQGKHLIYWQDRTSGGAVRTESDTITL